MPELPDVTVYVEALRARANGRVLRNVRFGSPFVLRSVEPPVSSALGHAVEDVTRLGKRVVLHLEGDFHFVIHLMVAGRLFWKGMDAPVPARSGLCAFDFENGTLLLTEVSTKKRASLHLVRGRDAVQAFHRGGLELADASLPRFTEVLKRENHTLKRALTDPRLFSGIGNSYSDEILHRARLSPVKLTFSLTDPEVMHLYNAALTTLTNWTDRLRSEVGAGWPEKVTAFRPDMAVHGKYKEPCPVCRTPVQRVVYAENETNYCPRCQTGGKMLADRSLSRLLKDDWPRTFEELEEYVAVRNGSQ